MEEDILNYLPTVMFRGTPCISRYVIIIDVRLGELNNIVSGQIIWKYYFKISLYLVDFYFLLPNLG